MGHEALYNVGQKVRVIHLDDWSSQWPKMRELVGEVDEIEACEFEEEAGGYVYQLSNGFYYHEDCLEAVSMQPVPEGHRVRDEDEVPEETDLVGFPSCGGYWCEHCFNSEAWTGKTVETIRRLSGCWEDVYFCCPIEKPVTEPEYRFKVGDRVVVSDEKYAECGSWYGWEGVVTHQWATKLL